MTIRTNWPNPERPGFPMFPERDGWHWLSNSLNDAPFPAEWAHEDYCNAETKWFWDMGEEREDAHEMKGLYYHGPCLTPTQISEMLAGERERCVSAFAAHGERAELGYNGSTSDEEKQYWRGAINTFEECRDEICHMGDPS